MLNRNKKMFLICFRSLEKSGRMWRETYEEIMNASKTMKTNT